MAGLSAFSPSKAMPRHDPFGLLQTACVNAGPGRSRGRPGCCARRHRRGRERGRVVRCGAARGVDDVREKDLAGQQVKNLGQVGMQALAPAGSEDDDVHGGSVIYIESRCPTPT